MKDETPMSKARVLVYDIETSPIISYNWGIWEQNAIEVIEDWQILSVAWHWLGDNNKKGKPIVHVIGQDDFPNYRKGVNDDLMVVLKLHMLFDEADVVIAHNGDKFDQRKSHARMITHDMDPPSPYKQIDTRKVARKYGAFTSNKLADLAKQLEISLKDSPGGFATWTGCLAGEKQAWKKMKEYNKQDIVVLLELYLKLRPWIQNHPAMNILTDRPDSCPKCSEGPMQRRGTLHTTKVGKVQRYQCQNCGGWSQDRYTQRTEVKYKN